MLQNITINFIFQVTLIFSRVGGAFAFLPGISERYILGHIKLGITLFMALVLQPVMMSIMPECPNTIGAVANYIAIEMLVGTILGLTARIYFLGLDVVGSIIGMQSGLSAASFFDPNQRSQVSIFSTLLMTVATITILVTDTHHLFIQGIIESYHRFSLGEMLNIGDTSNLISQVVNGSFVLSFKIAAPFLVTNVSIQVGSGVLSRLMPNLPIFFIVTPAQILITFAILLIMIQFMMSRIVDVVASIW